jgi:hypothetical protein
MRSPASSAARASWMRECMPPNLKLRPAIHIGKARRHDGSDPLGGAGGPLR